VIAGSPVRQRRRGCYSALSASPIPGAARRRQLKEITDVEHLHAAEGQQRLLAEMPEDGIYRVQRIGAHHTDLVDDEEFEFLQEFAFGALKRILRTGCWGPNKRGFPRSTRVEGGQEGAKGQLEKRVQGSSAGVDSGDAGRGGDGHFFETVLPDIFEEGGFACAGPACKKDGPCGLVDKLDRQLKHGIVGIG